jgi:GNAT superfamily N-acetyltransferase
MPRDFLYQEATSADVPAMARCRAADPEAGPADERMARYLDGDHHPQGALAPRTAFVALGSGEVVAYIAGHATTRHLRSDPVVSDPTVSGPNAVKEYECEGEVQYLYVSPTVRRRGVASELLRRLAGWFEQRGIRRVCVNVDVESPAATPFYVAARGRPLNRHWYVWDDIRSVSTADGGGRTVVRSR